MDFFDITIGSFQLQRWWAFNIADMAISVSIVYLVFIGLFGQEPESREQSQDESQAESEGSTT
jgi:lipoprotein signal peptidase